MRAQGPGQPRPVAHRAVGVQQADCAGGRRQFDHHGQRFIAPRQHALAFGRQIQKPAAAVAPPVILVDPPVTDMTHRQVFVIALDREKPGLVQPGDGRLALRAPVDQIPDGKQAIARGVETITVQRLAQARKMAMDVAHGDIPAARIGRQAENAAGIGNMSGQHARN